MARLIAEALGIAVASAGLLGFGIAFVLRDRLLASSAAAAGGLLIGILVHGFSTIQAVRVLFPESNPGVAMLVPSVSRISAAAVVGLVVVGSTILLSNHVAWLGSRPRLAAAITGALTAALVVLLRPLQMPLY